MDKNKPKPGPAAQPPYRSPSSPLLEGIDFYWEQGLMVLTEDFLRRRGYCCDSGCRHCPYGSPAGPSPR